MATTDPDVDAAAAAAIAVITERFDMSAIDDLDVSVSARDGTLTVDVYIDVPSSTASEIDAAADAAVDAAVAAIDDEG